VTQFKNKRQQGEKGPIDLIDVLREKKEKPTKARERGSGSLTGGRKRRATNTVPLWENGRGELINKLKKKGGQGPRKKKRGPFTDAQQGGNAFQVVVEKEKVKRDAGCGFHLL